MEAGNVAYGVSKAALIAFNKTLAAEVNISKIRVNCIAPGMTESKMSNSLISAAHNKMIEDSAMKREAKAEEIAKVAVFLASDDASFINGETIRVDGGRI